MTRQVSAVGLHAGNALCMVADKYPGVAGALIECAQNAIDANATRFFIAIDRLGDSIAVYFTDNGDGATASEFDAALGTIAKSQKRQGKLGKYGIGVMAPLTKCETFCFVSKSRHGRPADLDEGLDAEAPGIPVRWTFRQSEIRQQARGIEVPREVLPAMPQLPSHFQEFATGLNPAADWHTMVIMQRVTSDTVASRVSLDDLVEDITRALGPTMRQQGVIGRVIERDDRARFSHRDIKPSTYTGEALPLYTVKDGMCGRVEVELYRAPRQSSGKRNGEVVVSELDPVYPIAWKSFLNQAQGARYASDFEVFRVLGEGYFEGIIRAEKITLGPCRTKFVKNDVLESLYLVLQDWYEAEGHKYYEQARDKQEGERYERLALEVMSEVKSNLRTPAFGILAAGLRESVSMGRVGDGHAPTKGGTPDSAKTLRTGQGGAGKKKPRLTEKTAGQSATAPVPAKTEDPKSRDGDMPVGVVAKRGARRTLVRDNSVGLWIEVIDFEFGTHLWDFNRDTGVLSFNCGNALWGELDGASLKRRTPKNDNQIKRLQMYVLLELLALMAYDPSLENFTALRQMVDNKLGAFVKTLL